MDAEVRGSVECCSESDLAANYAPVHEQLSTSRYPKRRGRQKQTHSYCLTSCSTADVQIKRFWKYPKPFLDSSMELSELNEGFNLLT